MLLLIFLIKIHLVSLSSRLLLYYCCNLKKVTEYEKNKTEVGIEMENFIILIKYNSHNQLMVTP